MKKEYVVTKTLNGFIIRFSHRDKSYDEANMAVATTLEDVAKIIKSDLEEKTIKEK